MSSPNIPMTDHPIHEKTLSDTSGDDSVTLEHNQRLPSKEETPANLATAPADQPHSPRPSVNPLSSAFRVASDESSTFGPRRPTAEWAREVASEPPPLPYSLYEHKLTIFVFWFLIAAESCFIPISFYYGLLFGTNLRHGACKLK